MGFTAALSKAKKDGVSLAKELNEYKKDIDHQHSSAPIHEEENHAAAETFAQVSNFSLLIKFLLSHNKWHGTITAGSIDSEYTLNFDSIESDGEFKGTSVAFMQTGLQVF